MWFLAESRLHCDSSFSSSSPRLCPFFSGAFSLFFLVLPKHPSFLFYFILFYMCLLVCGHCPSTCENKIFERVESKTITRVELLCFEIYFFMCVLFLFSLFYVPFLFLLWPVLLFYFLFWLNVLRSIYSNIKVNFGVSIFII